jgi:hypothetical protein
MGALKTLLLVGLLLVQLVGGGVYRLHSDLSILQDRIAKPDPKKDHSIQDAKDWKNPYLVVRRDGIEIVGMTQVGYAISIESVPGMLEKLPDSAWPYGLVVAVQDIGILSGKTDQVRIEANRTKLLNLLKEVGATVDRWPSA